MKYNKTVRLRYLFLAILSLCLAGVALGQDPPPPVEKLPVDKSAPPPKDNRAEPPRHDADLSGESSSKQTQIDVDPPKDDDKNHPHSYEVDTDADVGEFHAFDPHKAMKCVEVGDFYYKQENYAAAISRYQEALHWKPDDAEATFKLAQAMEKSGAYSEAADNYRTYLKILPQGPFAEKAQKALGHLKDKTGTSSAKATPKPAQD